MFLKQFISVLVGLGSLAVSSGLPAGAMTLNQPINSIAQVRHNNGGLISLNGELLPFGGPNSDLFPVFEGDIIKFDHGYTDFDLLISDPEQVKWELQIFPGDSDAYFNLEGYVVNTNKPFTTVTNLPSGNGFVAAYGFDPKNLSPVVLKPLLTESESVPEPGMGLGILIAIRMGYAMKTRMNNKYKDEKS